MRLKLVLAMGVEGGLVVGGPPWGRSASSVVVGVGMVVVMVICFDRLW